MPDLNTITGRSIESLIERAFEEDIRSGDVTTNAIVEEHQKAKAAWVSKEKGVVAGLDIARLVFQELDPKISWLPEVEDGDLVEVGTELVGMEGSCRAILTAERIALNIVQRMSGIATLTNRFVKETGDLDTKILDTRKTVPGMRSPDKYAVAAGGGTNHRMGLFDMAMIKDNHIVAAGGIQQAVEAVRERNPEVRIEVETTTLGQVKKALAAGADIIMLDNMGTGQMSEAVALVKGRALLEASGNIGLDRVREVAETGVDFISVGALTHSVEAFDISQQLKEIIK